MLKTFEKYKTDIVDTEALANTAPAPFLQRLFREHSVVELQSDIFPPSRLGPQWTLHHEENKQPKKKNSHKVWWDYEELEDIPFKCEGY